VVGQAAVSGLRGAVSGLDGLGDGWSRVVEACWGRPCGEDESPPALELVCGEVDRAELDDVVGGSLHASPTPAGEDASRAGEVGPDGFAGHCSAARQ
jgi:hypothetical protein